MTQKPCNLLTEPPDRGNSGRRVIVTLEKNEHFIRVYLTDFDSNERDFIMTISENGWVKFYKKDAERLGFGILDDET